MVPIAGPEALTSRRWAGEAGIRDNTVRAGGGYVERDPMRKRDGLHEPAVVLCEVSVLFTGADDMGVSRLREVDEERQL
jgi:hypothetical protein